MSDVIDRKTLKPASIEEEISRPAALQFDAARYRADLAELHLTQAQEDELMAIVWNMMSSFVTLGVSVDVCTALFADRSSIPDDDGMR